MSSGTVPNPAPTPSSDESAAALRAFFQIAEAWKLSTDDQIKLLGSPGRSTFFKWKKETPQLPPDTVERVSHVLSIYRSLELLLPDPTAADSWVHQPNKAPLFNGKSAMDRMLSGQFSDLYTVRQYLDAQRGG
jgi:Protein of unknown function (DUF2384).